MAERDKVMAKQDFNWADFAQQFLANRLEGFKKDMRVCLRPDEQEPNKVAFFPGLLTCISLLELLSGLYAGKVTGHSPARAHAYAAQFMDPQIYSDRNVEILYGVYRHKIAHLGHPYYVFDTGTNPTKFPGPRQRITFNVRAGGATPAVFLHKHVGIVSHLKVPWSVPFDHEAIITVTTFRDDVLDSIPNYLAAVSASPDLQQKFELCMKEFFPPEEES